MQLVSVAFDVDGCLRDMSVDQNLPPVANEDVRSMLVFLSRFRNVVLYVWSGQGAKYAEDFCKQVGIWEYVEGSGGDFLQKMNPAASVGFKQLNGFQPDIAVDNDVRLDTGKVNLYCGNQGEVYAHDANGDELGAL